MGDYHNVSKLSLFVMDFSDCIKGGALLHFIKLKMIFISFANIIHVCFYISADRLNVPCVNISALYQGHMFHCSEEYSMLLGRNQSPVFVSFDTTDVSHISKLVRP